MDKDLQQKTGHGFKVVLHGPESSGKTTLARALSQHYETGWVPEYAREYLQKKWDSYHKICEPSDLLPIAIGQMKLENENILSHKSPLFFDTNLISTMVYSEVYFGFCDEKIKKAALENQYDLYLLTDIDIPWETDDLRDKPHERKEMYEAFEQALIQFNLPYIKISGHHEKRLSHAIHVVNECLALKKLGFMPSDWIQILQRNVSANTLEQQLTFLSKGIPKIDLDRPATLQDGIMPLSKSEAIYYQTLFDDKKQNINLKKFVPASGAASRMFKFLFHFYQEFDMEKETLNGFINKNKAQELKVFVAGLEKFPFFKNVVSHLQSTVPNVNQMNKEHQLAYFVRTILTDPAFDYMHKPKGILPFHLINGKTITPTESHLMEALDYANSNQRVNIHFTISKEHQHEFEKIIDDTVPKLETENQVTFNIRFSYQNVQTDTLALDLNKKPFRLPDGTLFFRPGGHGALIENLNQLNSDFVFIKNIDNVSPNNLETHNLYKKALGGILYTIQQKVFEYLHYLDSKTPDKEVLDEIIRFIKQNLNTEISNDFQFFTKEHKVDYLKKIMNRPIRVCGMVQNESEPGGGPFWVKDNKGNKSLQIVESSQVDFDQKKQSKIFKKSTFFNPVDLVCGIRNYRGTKFDLLVYVDPNSGFIAEKTKNGADIMVYELPGLWNGAMAYWITIFVEVPVITFNPVKTVNDLLKTNHQSYKL